MSNAPPYSGHWEQSYAEFDNETLRREYDLMLRNNRVHERSRYGPQELEDAKRKC
jgi:hypothetical protein